MDELFSSSAGAASAAWGSIRNWSMESIVGAFKDTWISILPIRNWNFPVHLVCRIFSMLVSYLIRNWNPFLFPVCVQIPGGDSDDLGQRSNFWCYSFIHFCIVFYAFWTSVGRWNHFILWWKLAVFCSDHSLCHYLCRIRRVLSLTKGSV